MRFARCFPILLLLVATLQLTPHAQAQAPARVPHPSQAICTPLPAGVDPITFTPAQLSHYGLPPNDGSADWHYMVTHIKERGCQPLTRLRDPQPAISSGITPKYDYTGTVWSGWHVDALLAHPGLSIEAKGLWTYACMLSDTPSTAYDTQDVEEYDSESNRDMAGTYVSNVSGVKTYDLFVEAIGDDPGPVLVHAFTCGDRVEGIVWYDSNAGTYMEVWDVTTGYEATYLSTYSAPNEGAQWRNSCPTNHTGCEIVDFGSGMNISNVTWEDLNGTFYGTYCPTGATCTSTAWVNGSGILKVSPGAESTDYNHQSGGIYAAQFDEVFHTSS